MGDCPLSERVSLFLDWFNVYAGALFEGSIDNLSELSDGLKVYELLQKVSQSIFVDLDNLNKNPSIWVLKKSNLTSLVHGINEFGISSLRGDSSFDLGQIVDVTKISKLDGEGDEGCTQEGLLNLVTLLEYVLTVSVLSGDAVILEGLRKLPRTDQQSLSSTVKRVMTLHGFNKLKSYLSVHSLAAAASSSARDLAGSFSHSAFQISHRASVGFEDGPLLSTREEEPISPSTSQPIMWKPSVVVDTESLRAEMGTLQNSVRDLKQDLDVKTQEVQIYQSEVESLRAQNEEYKATLTELHSRGFSEKEKHLMQALGEAEEKARVLQADVESAKSLTAHMKESISSLALEKKQLEQKLSELQALSSLTDEVRQSLTSQNRELEQKLKSSTYSENELRATIRQLREEKEALQLAQTVRSEDDFADPGELEASVEDKRVLLSEIRRLKGELNVINLENTLLKSRVDGDGYEEDFESTARFHHARMDTLVAHGGPLSPPIKECASRHFEMTLRREVSESVARRLDDYSEPIHAYLHARGRSEVRYEFAPHSVDELHEIVASGLGEKGLATVFLFTDGGSSVACDDAELKAKLEKAVLGWKEKLDDPPVFNSAPQKQAKADAKGGCAEGCIIM